MTDQHDHWSRAALVYEKEFIDPYRKDVRNPLLKALKKLAGPKKDVADLGCGIGPLLPFLAERFRRVYAVDFAEGMLDRARAKATGLANIDFRRHDFLDLSALRSSVDVAVAVNSLILPNVADLDRALAQIKNTLRPGGAFVGILPAMDAVHYYLMLLVDRALAAGKTLDAARKNALHFAEGETYDFAFGQFAYEGLEQHFWQPFEIRHRFERAGFEMLHLKKVHLSWKQFACGADFARLPPPWDWFFWASH